MKPMADRLASLLQDALFYVEEHWVATGKDDDEADALAAVIRTTLEDYKETQNKKEPR